MNVRRVSAHGERGARGAPPGRRREPGEEGVGGDGHAGGDELGHGAHELADRLLPGDVERDDEVLARAEDARDPAAAEAARAVLDEDADAVGVGALDHAGKSRRVDGLAGDGHRGGVGGGGEGLLGAGGVDAHAGDVEGGAAVHLDPRLARLGDLGAVRGHGVAERQREVLAEPRDDAFARGGLAADHALLGGVDDGEVRERLAREGAAHVVHRRGDDPRGPRRRGAGDAGARPEAARRGVVADELRGQQRLGQASCIMASRSRQAPMAKSALLSPEE